jgi:hypothetical protein
MRNLDGAAAAEFADDAGDPSGRVPARTEDKPNQAQAGTLEMFGEGRTGAKCHFSSSLSDLENSTLYDSIWRVFILPETFMMVFLRTLPR